MTSNWLVAGMAVVALGAGLDVEAASLGARPDKVALVMSGKLKEAKASWWGFDGEDATEALQAAIDSRVPVLHVDAFAGAWIVRPIKGVSNQKIVFDPWVEVCAKKGEFLGLNDCLLTYVNATNVTLSGKNATLRMNRWDYHAAPYKKGEWRHALSLLGCTDMLIEGLTFAESGGDGIYVSTSPQIHACRRVTIRDCVCEKNYRQGISVISAEDLLIERTVMRDTKGTAPEAGIDFEPNKPFEILRNCEMRDCVCENNAGDALEIYIGQFDRSTSPVSIRIQNTRLKGGRHAFSLGTGNGARKNGYVRGVVGLENCLLEQSDGSSIHVSDNPANSIRVAFANCLVREGGVKVKTPVPEVTLHTNTGSLELTDGLLFRNVRIAQTAPHPWISKVECSWRRKGIELISGDVTVETAEGEQRIVLDDAWRKSWFGAPDKDLPQYLPPRYTNSLKVSDAKEGELSALSPFRVRGEARYAFYVAKPTRVVLKGRLTTYGNPQTSDWKVTTATKGDLVATGKMAAKAGEIAFDVPATGFYIFSPGLAGRHAYAVSEANVPMALEVPESGLHMMAGGATGLIMVSGHRRFYVYAQADGLEYLAAKLQDPTGRDVWRDDQIEDASGWKSPENPQAGLWKLTTARPDHGCFEDHSVSLGGVTGWLFLSKDRYWNQ